MSLKVYFQADLLPVVHLSSGPSMVDQTSSSGGEERRADKLDPDPHPVPVPDPNPDPDPHPVPDSDPDSDLFSKRFENCGTN